MRIKRFLFSLGVLVLVSGMASGASVSARGGDDINQQSTSSSGSPTGHSEETETEIENHAHDLAEQFKKQAQTNISDKKTQGASHSHEQRQKSCEARKANLTKRMDNAVSHAEKHMATFDKIYNRVKDFKTDKNLTVDNYDALVAAVDQAQSDAQASIDALKALDVSVDCTSDNVAQNIAAFQEAVKASRDSLKAYRTSITDHLIKSVKAGASDSTTTEDSQTETEGQ